ncbi:hypothetical protein HDU92_003711 [Lobulomyces angularis]|nr:hypothetical protein HDU92_003711 [Lobulomyces angularis]
MISSAAKKVDPPVKNGINFNIQRKKLQLQNSINEHKKQLLSKHKEGSQNDSLKNESNNDIITAYRTRPLLRNELSQNKFEGIFMQDNLTYIYHPIDATLRDLALETHKFENVDFSFNEKHENEFVFQSLVKPLIPFVLNENGLATFIAYGQTGAGKTHTMSSFHEMIPDEIDFRKTLVKVCYFEIFGDDLFDLLNDRKPIFVLSTSTGTAIKGVTQEIVSSAEELKFFVESGTELRKTRATLKNDQSSRSHSVFILSLAAKTRENLKTFQLKKDSVFIEGNSLIIVDLAGSERNSDQTHHDKVRIKETQITNTSLMSLKDCIRNRYLISLLNANSNKHIHMPFRSSKLTQVLREGLDPNSTLKTKTVMIGHLAPSIEDSQHSLNTARYVSNLKASNNNNISTIDRVRSSSNGNSSESIKHPSKWTYKQLCLKIKNWSMNSIDLTKILKYHDTDVHSQNHEVGRPPVWLELSNMSTDSWVRHCKAQGVSSETAKMVFNKYKVELNVGRKQQKGEGENVYNVNCVKVGKEEMLQNDARQKDSYMMVDDYLLNLLSCT